MRPTTLIWHEIIPQLSAPTVCFIGLSRWMDGTVATRLREHHKSAGDSIKTIKAATETEKLERQDAVLHIKAPPVLTSCTTRVWWEVIGVLPISCDIFQKVRKVNLSVFHPWCVCVLLVVMLWRRLHLRTSPDSRCAFRVSGPLSATQRRVASWRSCGLEILRWWHFLYELLHPWLLFFSTSEALGVTKGQRNAKDLKIIGWRPPATKSLSINSRPQLTLFMSTNSTLGLDFIIFCHGLIAEECILLMQH